MTKTILVCGKCGALQEYRVAKESGWVVAHKARHGLILRCPQCVKNYTKKASRQG